MSIERSIVSAIPILEHSEEIGGEAKVIQAATTLFYRLGFHGTSTRALAREADMGQASMYHYFPSKYDMLLRILDETMEQLYDACHAALEASADTPEVQLDAIVRAHCSFHTDRQRESFITNTEIRSLTEPDRQRHVAARDRHQRMFDGVIVAGADSGAFRTPYPIEASRAIVTMTTAVATWYRPHGPLSREDIADRYAALALAQVEVRPRKTTRAKLKDERHD